MELQGDNDKNYNWFALNDPRKFGKGVRRVENRRTNG